MKLKPCPFCGGKAVLECIGNDGLSYHVSMAYVECVDCEAVGSVSETIEDYTKEGSDKCAQLAVDSWNKRT